MESPNLISASATEIQSLLTSRQITSVSLVEQCLSQIEKHDRQGAELRAMMFVTKKEKLMEIASGLDSERKVGKVRGPLHGVPIVVKDQWQTHPSYGMPCTAGMAALLGAKNGDSNGLMKKVC
jgi:amidase